MPNLLELKGKQQEALLFLIIILSGLMAATAMLFNAWLNSEFINHPQFTYFHKYNEIRDRIRDSGGSPFYITFFVFDFFWAPAVLLWTYNFIKNLALAHFTKLLWILFYLAILAFMLDILESIGYLYDDGFLGKRFMLDRIVKFKVFLYAAVAFILLIALYQRYIVSHLQDIRRALRASIFSLIIILLILILATKLDQGSTVIIHLLSSPVSILVCACIICILALACAHYPDYLYKYIYAKNDSSICWRMKPISFFTSRLGMGIVYYEVQPGSIWNNKFEPGTQIFDVFRKNLGGLLLLTWIFVLLYVLNRFVEADLPVMLICLLIVVGYIFIYRRCYKAKFNNEGSIAYFEQRTRIYFAVFIATLVLTVVSSMFLNWIITLGMLILTTMFNTLFYIYFQFFRTGFYFQSIQRFFKNSQPFSLGNTVGFLTLFAVMGWTATVIYIAFSFHPPLLSALCFILLWMYILYGGITILLKHHMFYSRHQCPEPEVHRPAFFKIFFQSYVPVLWILLGGWLLYTSNVGNGLHMLPMTAESANTVSLDEYVGDTTDCKKYYVASYGGGLRATIWTMLLLNESPLNSDTFLHQTAAMSGVSGGFLGLAFNTALHHEFDSIDDKKEAIKRIGRHNMLAIDVSYLLGFDFLREFIPYVEKLGKDRACRSMEEYASLLQPNESKRNSITSLSYREYWAETYKKRNFIPVLIGNTTGTHHRYGAALSVKTRSTNSVLPGAQNILTTAPDSRHVSISDTALTFLGATSTTERFPIFSPTAQIKGIGHFLDGGYFENSGLLSLKNFSDYYSKGKNCPEGEEKIILIVNSKEDYIKHVISPALLRPEKDVPSGEFNAILSTVSDTDILPHALEDRYREEYDTNFITIYLPYSITFDDVIGIIGNMAADPFAIETAITDSNEKIRKVLNKGYSTHIAPALARVLSDPAFDYMVKMLEHEEVKAAIAKIYK